MINEIIDSLVDVVFFISVEPDGHFKFVNVNNSFLTTTGLKREQVVGKYIHEVIPEPSLSLVLKHYQTAIKERRIVKWEEITEYPSGMKYGDVTIVPIFNKTGECHSLVGNVHDVTALRESESNQQKTMERISDGIVAFDTEYRYTYVNKRASEMLGRAASELVGRVFFEVFPKTEANAFSEAFLNAMKTQKPVEVTEFYAPWGKWFVNRIFPSEDGLTVFFTDVTDDMNRDIELDKARHEAEQALVAKSRFLDIAAHELRNPVASLYLMLQVMDRQVQNNIPIDSEKITELLHPASRLNRLVADLLDLSRLEKDVMTLNLEKHDILHCLQGWFKELKILFPHRSIHLHGEDKKIEFFFDSVRVYQVIMNLVENSIKYSKQGTSVEIFLDDLEGFVKISVIDQGEGLTEKMMETILDPFSRGGMDIKVRHTGLGLGLPISDKIIKLHHGEFGIKSEVGKGSTFSFTLPKRAMA